MTPDAAAQPDHPFNIADGRAAGLTRGVLAGPRYAAPYYGVRQLRVNSEPDADAPARRRPPDVRAQLWRSCRQYAVRMHPAHFFSHDTALALVGAPLPTGWRPALHVSVHRPANCAHVRGVLGHRLQDRTPAFIRRDGLMVENPVRAWVQAADLWLDDDLIAAADFLVLPRRRLATIDELRAEALTMRRRRLEHLLDEVRQGSESSQETRLRLALVRAGLPEPELNMPLFSSTGQFIARLDQMYRRYRVAVEYDGRQHAEDTGQFQRDADRWAAIRDAGWELVRILHHHMGDQGSVAVEKVRRALLRAGWRPDV